MKQFESDALREFRSAPDFHEIKSHHKIEKESFESNTPVAVKNDPQVRMTFYTHKSFQQELKRRALAADMSLSSYILTMVKKGMGV